MRLTPADASSSAMTSATRPLTPRLSAGRALDGSDLEDERVLDLVAELAPDALRLQELVHGLDAVLASEAARLDAAERRVERERPVDVDPDGAGLQPARHPVRALELVRPDACGEPVGRPVRERHDLVLVVEREHAENGAEDLLLDGAAVRRHAGEERGGVEVAAVEPRHVR